jgi:hypothetical protein
VRSLWLSNVRRTSTLPPRDSTCTFSLTAFTVPSPAPALAAAPKTQAAPSIAVRYFLATLLINSSQKNIGRILRRTGGIV